MAKKKTHEEFIEELKTKNNNCNNFTKYRIKQRFKDIYSDSKTEFEMMDELGALRIYDCGNAKYIIYIEN